MIRITVTIDTSGDQVHEVGRSESYEMEWEVQRTKAIQVGPKFADAVRKDIDLLVLNLRRGDFS